MADTTVVPTIYGLAHMVPNFYSGYGMSRTNGRKDRLSGLLKVRPPLQESMEWLQLLKVMFGTYSLFQVTNDGGMGLACNMYVSPDSMSLIQPFPRATTPAFYAALSMYLAVPPQVDLELRWEFTSDGWATRCVTDPLGTTPGKPRFLLGNLFASSSAHELLARDASQIARILRRHVTADWGVVSAELRRKNFLGIRHDGLLVSQHDVLGGERVYIVTEGDRSRTSVVLTTESTDKATSSVSLLTTSDEDEADDV